MVKKPKSKQYNGTKTHKKRKGKGNRCNEKETLRANNKENKRKGKGRKKGRKEGRKEGKREGKREEKRSEGRK